ncbi:MAG: general secretion pathway protein GspK [Phycisphaerae bacterium]|nr:general secretion pathway protein GspK [Phycisphaerae bacterium]
MRNKGKTGWLRCGGLVLIGVLWVMVLLDMLVFVIARTGRLDARISLSMEEKIRGKWAGRAGVETGIALLLEDEKDSDSLFDAWALSTADTNSVALDACTFSITVIDEAGKININSATKDQLMALPGMTDEISDCILDWRDNDDEVRANGAESAYYLNLPYPYQPRNGAFKTVRELLLVKGVSPQLVYGYGLIAETTSEYNAGWVNYLTCYSYDNNNDADGNARININSASASQMEQQLGITAGQAQWIVQNRSYSSLGSLLDKITGGTGTTGTAGTSGSGGQQQGSGMQLGGQGGGSGRGTQGSGQSGGMQGGGTQGGGRSGSQGGGRQSNSGGLISPFGGIMSFLSALPAQGPGGGGGSSSGGRPSGGSTSGGGRGGEGGGRGGEGGGGRGGFGGGQGGGGRGGFGGGQGGGGRGGFGGGGRGGMGGGPGGGGQGGGGRGGFGGGRGGETGGRGQGNFGGPGGQGGMRPGGMQGGVASTAVGSGTGGSTQAEPLDLDTFYKIADKITTSTRTRIRGRVNVNTAPLGVLSALLEGRQEVAEDIIAYRESQMNGITSITDLRDIKSIDLDLAKKFIDYVTTRSSVYTIRVLARTATSGGQYETQAVVDRALNPVQILYYREGAGH